jgi:hypothetical protein
MSGLNLKLRNTGIVGNGARVWLDGHEISHGLTGLDISLDVSDATTATLRILVDDLDIDAQTLAVLEAHVREGGSEPQTDDLVEVTSLGSETRAYYRTAPEPSP